MAFYVHIKEYEGKMLDQPSQMGVSLGPDGRLIVRYLDKDGQKIILDLTAAIEEIAERKVQEHMKAWHNHQL